MSSHIIVPVTRHPLSIAVRVDAVDPYCLPLLRALGRPATAPTAADLLDTLTEPDEATAPSHGPSAPTTLPRIRTALRYLRYLHFATNTTRYHKRWVLTAQGKDARRDTAHITRQDIAMARTIIRGSTVRTVMIKLAGAGPDRSLTRHELECTREYPGHHSFFKFIPSAIRHGYVKRIPQKDTKPAAYRLTMKGVWMAEGLSLLRDPKTVDQMSEEIVDRYRQGTTMEQLAIGYGIATPTISDLIKKHR